MDAKELTKEVIKLQNEVFVLKKKADFIEMEFQKQRLLMEDLRIDVAMLNKRGD